MSPEAELRRLIARAERLLPGRSAPQGKLDPRWQAIIRIADHLREQPEPVWSFTLKWGRHAQADLRAAVATVLLEHLLEHHFELVYPRVRDAARRSTRFRDTLSRCWWLGTAAEPANARKLDRLTRMRHRPKRPRS
jgi:hypothetical protein